MSSDTDEENPKPKSIDIDGELFSQDENLSSEDNEDHLKLSEPIQKNVKSVD
jgi:hypothetical protein